MASGGIFGTSFTDAAPVGVVVNSVVSSSLFGTHRTAKSLVGSCLDGRRTGQVRGLVDGFATAEARCTGPIGLAEVVKLRVTTRAVVIANRSAIAESVTDLDVTSMGVVVINHEGHRRS